MVKKFLKKLSSGFVRRNEKRIFYVTIDLSIASTKTRDLLYKVIFQDPDHRNAVC